MRTRETGLFYIIMVVALALAIPFGMLTLMLGSAFIIGYPDEGAVKLFLSVTGALIGSLMVYMLSSIKYSEASRVEVREDGPCWAVRGLLNGMR